VSRARKRVKEASRPPASATAGNLPERGWIIWAGLAAAALAAFLCYAPALHGPFVFDDVYLPFGRPDPGSWVHNPIVDNRPLLMISFWLNYRADGTEPYYYHLANVFIHVAVGMLVFLVLRRILRYAGEPDDRSNVLSALGAAVYLVHPIHTEAVAYVASRSDLLSTAFTLACLALFLRWHRSERGIGFGQAALALGTMAAALLCKEQAAVAPALLLAADYFWNPGFSLRGILRNWRLHGLVALGGMAGLAFVIRTLIASDTAGFNTQGIRWYEYFFTQCRVLWRYLGLVALPLGQNLDPEIALSRTIADPAVIAGMLALAAVSVAAWIWRREFPVAAFGWVMFLLMIAPTSSIVPIRDLSAERRVYFPFIGLLLVALEGARRVRLSRPLAVSASAAALLALCSLTAARSELWGDPIALWSDTAQKSPNKARPSFQLGYAYYTAGRPAEAVRAYEHAARVEKPNLLLLTNWALALDSGGDGQGAVRRLHEALQLEPSAHAYAALGMVLGKMGRSSEALSALDAGEKLDPIHWPLFLYRGNVYVSLGNWSDAEKEYRRVLQLDPGNQAAEQGLRLTRERSVPR
jgi:tetratricopeptide (TPR) repeat protein